MANYYKSLNEAFDSKFNKLLNEGLMKYREVWGQVDDDPYEFAKEYNLQCREIKNHSKNIQSDETMYEFTGHIDDFNRAVADGYFQSMDYDDQEYFDEALSDKKFEELLVETDSTNDRPRPKFKNTPIPEFYDADGKIKPGTIHYLTQFCSRVIRNSNETTEAKKRYYQDTIDNMKGYLTQEIKRLDGMSKLDMGGYVEKDEDESLKEALSDKDKANNEMIKKLLTKGVDRWNKNEREFASNNKLQPVTYNRKRALMKDTGNTKDALEKGVTKADLENPEFNALDAINKRSKRYDNKRYNNAARIRNTTREYIPYINNKFDRMIFQNQKDYINKLNKEINDYMNTAEDFASKYGETGDEKYKRYIDRYLDYANDAKKELEKVQKENDAYYAFKSNKLPKDESLKEDINKPEKPVRVFTETNTFVECPNCGYSFKKAQRCPECGQLIDYTETELGE